VALSSSVLLSRIHKSKGLKYEPSSEPQVALSGAGAASEHAGKPSAE